MNHVVPVGNMIPTPGDQYFQPQVYTSTVQKNTSMISTSLPVTNMIPTPGFNQNMQPQMELNFYDQQGGANSNYNYKVPNAEVVNVPMHENVSTMMTTFDLSLDELMTFNSQSDVDELISFIDSPNVATPSYDFSWPSNNGN